MERWLGKVAVITGASVGIGAATALTLAEAGFKVVGLARRVELVEELRSKLSSDAKGALFARKCDISKEEDIKAAFDWIIQQFGGVDVLINNAAVFHISPLTGPDAAKLLRESLDTNVMAVVLCTREAYQSMKSRGTPGHVIHINALLGHRIPYVPNTFFNVYPPTKYALTALTEVHRQEFLNDGSKVKVTVSVFTHILYLFIVYG